MFSDIEQLIRELNLRSHRNEGILVVQVDKPQIGFTFVEQSFNSFIDTISVLYLSGGRTPKELYEILARGEQIVPGAVGIVDERFGEPLHLKSNEKMIQETGLLTYFKHRDVPFYPVLRPGLSREETAERYDEKLRDLLARYQKQIAILGVGMDGHTAGIPVLNHESSRGQGLPKAVRILNQEVYTTNELVTSYKAGGMYGERVTMTFMGLSMMDLLIVLVFGDDKKKALELMFSDGPEEEIPSRFYKRPEIAAKTILITDQEV